jgi:hypothetical protein
MPPPGEASDLEVPDGLVWTEVQGNDITYVGSPKELYDELKHRAGQQMFRWRDCFACHPMEQHVFAQHSLLQLACCTRVSSAACVHRA